MPNLVCFIGLYLQEVVTGVDGGIDEKAKESQMPNGSLIS